MTNEDYWWCFHCQVNVGILIAHELGIFCRECGRKIRMPADRRLTGIILFDFDDGSDEEAVIDRMIQ